MSKDLLFDPIYTKKLIGLDKYLNELILLYDKKLLPRVSMLSGNKGIGKFTLINHFLNYVFSKEEKSIYDKKNFIINDESLCYKKMINNSYQNTIFINCSSTQTIKIDNIRSLKSLLLKTNLDHKPRFVIVDEIEFLNVNSINALLKIIEEPSGNNFFIFINNNQAPLLETLSSRCIKTNIFINAAERNKIIQSFVNLQDIDLIIDFTKNNLSPGLFLTFNNFCINNEISAETDINIKISTLLIYYKKNKIKLSINLLIFFVEQYFYTATFDSQNKIFLLVKIRRKIINYINDFVKYNLNVNTLINLIETELKYV